MTIGKAIKNLAAGREDCGMIPEDEYTQTIDLATEALKRVKRYKRLWTAWRMELLPGETKE